MSMTPQLVPLLLLAAVGCTGTIESLEPSPAGAEPTAAPGAVAGRAGSERGPRPGPGTTPGVFTFECPDPERSEPRPLRRLSKGELRAHLVNVLSGTSLQGVAGTRVDRLLDLLPEDTGDPTHFAEEILETSDGHLQALLLAAESFGALVSALDPADHDLLSSKQCQGLPATLDACAKGLADELGLRLHRRPLSGDEVASLRRHLAELGVSSPAAAAGAASAFLFLLPASLLHLEDRGEPVSGGQAIRLTSFEAMNRVHFGLLGAPPPVTLLEAIGSPGWSREKAERRVDEILASTAFKARMLSFFESWLGFGPAVDLSTLPAKMAAGLVTKEVPGEAYDELRAFLTATVFTSGGSVADLYLSNRVHHLGPNLARIYGLAGVDAKGPATPPRELDEAKHVGLLSRAAMNLHAESQTSPIGRGVRVKRKLLCEDIHPPPGIDLAGEESMVIDDPTRFSNRFLVENKTRSPLCQACHASIDSIGFSLEFYDSLGRYRDEEVRYDEKGNVVNTFALSSDDIRVQVLPGKKVEGGGPIALAREIVATEKGSACFVSQWQSFTGGSDKFDATSCLKRRLHEQAKGSGGILQMVRAGAVANLDALKDLRRAP